MTKKERQPPKSAAEVMARLRNDPTAAARTAQQEESRRQIAEAYIAAARELLTTLSAAGFTVDTIGELRKYGSAYAGVVPLLANALLSIQCAPVREDIARVLAVPWAAAARRDLISGFERELEPAVRWAIGNALEVLANDEIRDDLVRFARDPRFGKAREMVVLGLGKLSPPQVGGVLVELLTDDEVAGHAVMALGKLKLMSSRPQVERLLKHPVAWIRKEARNALKKIDRVRA